MTGRAVRDPPPSLSFILAARSRRREWSCKKVSKDHAEERVYLHKRRRLGKLHGPVKQLAIVKRGVGDVLGRVGVGVEWVG